MGRVVCADLRATTDADRDGRAGRGVDGAGADNDGRVGRRPRMAAGAPRSSAAAGWAVSLRAIVCVARRCEPDRPAGDDGIREPLPPGCDHGYVFTGLTGRSTAIDEPAPPRAGPPGAGPAAPDPQ